MSDAATTQFEATIEPGIEYGTDRPCEIGRLVYTVGVHRYVALTFRYTDEEYDWRLTWVGFEGTHAAVQLPADVRPSVPMLAALAALLEEAETSV